MARWKFNKPLRPAYRNVLHPPGNLAFTIHIALDWVIRQTNLSHMGSQDLSCCVLLLSPETLQNKGKTLMSLICSNTVIIWSHTPTQFQSLDDPHQLITVRRRHIWSDTKRVFSKPYANLVLPVKVVFVGEQAEDVDLKGSFSDLLLLRQLATLLSCLVPVTVELCNIGNLISMSIIQGGPWPMCFAPWICDYLSGHRNKPWSMWNATWRTGFIY